MRLSALIRPELLKSVAFASLIIAGTTAWGIVLWAYFGPLKGLGILGYIILMGGMLFFWLSTITNKERWIFGKFRPLSVAVWAGTIITFPLLTVFMATIVILAFAWFTFIRWQDIHK